MNHLKHATGALLFCLLLITAYSLEARACGGYQPQPDPVHIVCAAC